MLQHVDLSTEVTSCPMGRSRLLIFPVSTRVTQNVIIYFTAKRMNESISLSRISMSMESHRGK